MGRVPRTWPMHFEVDERTHRALHRARLFEDDYASALVSPEPSESRIQHSQWLGPKQLGLRSTLKPQCGKVGFIVKSGIGLGDLRLCLL
jgi:hypothetical protein